MPGQLGLKTLSQSGELSAVDAHNEQAEGAGPRLLFNVGIVGDVGWGVMNEQRALRRIGSLPVQRRPQR